MEFPVAKPLTLPFLVHLFIMSAGARGMSASSKKRGGGFLSRQAKARTDSGKLTGTTSEEDLLKKEFVTPDDVLRLNKVTESKLEFQ